MRSYLISIGSVLLTASICFLSTSWLSYQVVSLILLFNVSVLAMTLSLYPVLIAAFLSALIWDFFFLPPRFTFYITKSEDFLMLIMFFIIAILNGILTARFRHLEKLSLEKEKRTDTIKLYDTLFNSLSHELRTPIATILGASDNLLTDNIRITEGVKKELHLQINESAERLNRLVNNLLNMSRLDSGFIKPKIDWCDVDELIHTVVNSLKEERKHHKIVIDIEKNMSLVKIDFGLMEQALFTLPRQSFFMKCQAFEKVLQFSI